MKARLLTTAIRTGHAALDFIRLAQRNDHSSASVTRPKAKGAQEVLESFEDQDRSLPIDAAVPIKPLVRVLTKGLQGIPLADADGKMNSAKLFRGCRVRLVGIPERQFVICEIFWDYEEVRVGEIGTYVEYVLPWDCLRLCEE